MYLWIFDDNPKKTIVARLTDACAAYAARFHATPNVALVNPADVCAVEGVEVRPLARIQRNTFQVGRTENDNAE